MDVFERLGIEISNAVLVKGLTDTEEDEEVIDFLKQYGSISKLEVVKEPKSEFNQNLIVEYNLSTAVSTLEPKLPYAFVSDQKTRYIVRSLFSIYAEQVGTKKTESYLSDLKRLAKLTGKDSVEVLRDMMSQTGESIAELDPDVLDRKDPSEESPSIEKLSSQSPLKLSALPASSTTYSQPPSTGVHTNPVVDMNNPEVQCYVVEHTVKGEDASMNLLTQRLRIFSGVEIHR